jgi:hypothetical protein
MPAQHQLGPAMRVKLGEYRGDEIFSPAARVTDKSTARATSASDRPGRAQASRKLVAATLRAHDEQCGGVIVQVAADVAQHVVAEPAPPRLFVSYCDGYSGGMETMTADPRSTATLRVVRALLLECAVTAGDITTTPAASRMATTSPSSAAGRRR